LLYFNAGVFRIKYAKTPKHCKALMKLIKAYLPGNGKGHRIQVKPLKESQSFAGMLGYILKDDGQPWFSIHSFNIPRTELEAGRHCHMELLTTYDANKVTLSPKNFIAEAFKFSKRCLYPLLCPVAYTAMYMLQSGAYIPSPEWLKKLNKMDAEQTQVCLFSINLCQ